jgi:hypothetical protein
MSHPVTDPEDGMKPMVQGKYSPADVLELRDEVPVQQSGRKRAHYEEIASWRSRSRSAHRVWRGWQQ